MKKIFSRNNLKDITKWVWHGKYLIFTIIAVIVTVIITFLYFIRRIDFYPNWVGAAFSITGIAIILHQLFLDTIKFADQKPNTIRNWIKSFPTGKTYTIYGETGVFLSSSTLKSRGTISLPANATYENKVDFLLKQVNNIQDEIANVDNRVDEVTASLTEKTKEINTNLENIDKSLKTTISGHIVGTYDANLFGIIITICGTLLQFFYSLKN